MQVVDNDELITLSSKEVVDIIDDINGRYAPVEIVDTSPVISAREMRDISDNISLYYAPRIQENTKKLVLLPIDPTHIYAYWSLGDQQKNAMQMPEYGHQYVIKIFAQLDNNIGLDVEETVPDKTIIPVYQSKVAETQSGKMIDINLPVNALLYSAFIGIESEEEDFKPVVTSNAVSLENKSIKQEVMRDEPVNEAYGHIQQQIREMSLEGGEVLVSKKTHFAANNRSGQIKKD